MRIVNLVFWIAGGCAVTVGAAAVLLVLLRKKAQAPASPLQTHPLREKAALDFKQNASAFNGLYEPLYLIKTGKLKFGEGLFADWDARVNNFKDHPALLEVWSAAYNSGEGYDESSYPQKAAELLEFTQEAGVFRSEETEVTSSSEIFRYYFPKDGLRIEYGALANVDLPYWAIGDNVLEKGQISIKSESEEEK
jgi:hypothetical protein